MAHQGLAPSALQIPRPPRRGPPQVYWPNLCYYLSGPSLPWTVSCRLMETRFLVCRWTCARMPTAIPFHHYTRIPSLRGPSSLSYRPVRALVRRDIRRRYSYALFNVPSAHQLTNHWNAQANGAAPSFLLFHRGTQGVTKLHRIIYQGVVILSRL